MSFGITELAIILVIVLLLFGTTKLKSIGSDLGSAIKGFRSAVSQDDDISEDNIKPDEVKSVTDSADEVASKLKQSEQKN